MLKYIKKDITTVTEGTIAHGVNCQKVMGSGVAKALYTKWPHVKAKYLENHKNILGKVQWVRLNEGLWLTNCYTQQYFGSDGKSYGNVAAVVICLNEVLNESNGPVYIPRIGCGLAGLSWDKEVGPVLEDLARLHSTDLIVCDL